MTEVPDLFRSPPLSPFPLPLPPTLLPQPLLAARACGDEHGVCDVLTELEREFLEKDCIVTAW